MTSPKRSISYFLPLEGRYSLSFQSFLLAAMLLMLLIPVRMMAQMTSGGSDINGTVKVITLQEAVEMALDNSYLLKQAQNNLQLSESRQWSAAADFLPNLNGSMGRSRNIGRQFDNTSGEFGDFTINGFSASISSNMPLFTGFANINDLRASRQETISRQQQLERARENVIFFTATRYLQYLLSVRLLEISEENLIASRQQLERIRAQVEVGTRPTVDLLNQESTVANNELQVINRRNTVLQNRLELIRQLQLDPQEKVEFAEPELPEGLVQPKTYDLNFLVNTALENRSDLKSEEASIEAAYFAFRAAQGNYLPSLSANYSLRSSLNDRNPSSYDDQFFDQNISRSMGLSLSIPIFNRLNVRTGVQSQKIAYRNAKLSFDNTRLEVIQEVNQAYNDYQARIAEVESTEKAFKASERAYQTELERYEIGASTLIELSQAQALFVQARSNRVQALYSYYFQEQLLDYYLGRLDPTIHLRE